MNVVVVNVKVVVIVAMVMVVVDSRCCSFTVLDHIISYMHYVHLSLSFDKNCKLNLVAL